MKIGVSSYSFSRYMSEGRLDMFGVIRTAAEMGFDGIEFSGLGTLAEGEDAMSRAARIKAECAEVGLTIISYTIGADFLNSSAGDWQAEAERLRTEVDIAAALDTPCMRHDATRGFPGNRISLSDFVEALPILAKGCRAVTEYAADRGVRTTVENHGFFIQDGDRCAALMEAVSHPNFGALVDIGNFLCADEEPLLAVAIMAPYAFHVHAKDFHVKFAGDDPGKGWFNTRGGNHLRGAIVGHGDVDVPGCLALLNSAGYDGYVSIEFEGMEDNRLALEIGLENLRRYVEEI